MRSTFISMVCVLAVSIAICVVSMTVQFRVLGTMDVLCGDAVASVLDDDITSASGKVAQLRRVMDETTWFMELMAFHDQLHEAHASITDAQVALECEDTDDAYQSLKRLQGTIDHLRDHEKLSISNLC